MFLYVMEMSNSSWWKIGIAKDVTARLDGLQTGNPHKLTVYMALPLDNRMMALKLETDLLSMLSYAAGNGGGKEWVHLPKNELDKAINKLITSPISKKRRMKS